MVSSVRLVRKQPDENKVNFQEVFTACNITRSTRDNPDPVLGLDELKSGISEWCGSSLSDVPVSVKHEDLKVEQQADPSL